MPGQRKLGSPGDQRRALLRNQVSACCGMAELSYHRSESKGSAEHC